MVTKSAFNRHCKLLVFVSDTLGDLDQIVKLFVLVNSTNNGRSRPVCASMQRSRAVYELCQCQYTAMIKEGAHTHTHTYH